MKIALVTHELIKVKLGENVEGDRKDISAELASASAAHLVGVVGRTLLLFKRNAKKPKILMPGEPPPKVKPPPGKAKANRAKRADRKAKIVAKSPRQDRSTRATARVSRELSGREHASGTRRAGGGRDDDGDDEN